MAKKQKSELNAEQEKVFASFKAGANIFLCGKGGSGKSHLTRYIIDYCNSKNLSTLVCAPTGIAALKQEYWIWTLNLDVASSYIYPTED